MENSLVRFSRAGDVFHYRWAARRCLRLIYPDSLLRSVVIEGSGSKERELAGEYVIDVAEYSDPGENVSPRIAYFQLKHTTVRKERPFTLRDLKGTIIGFAERYQAQLEKAQQDRAIPDITFSIVTNRPIAESLKQNFQTLARGGTVRNDFRRSLEAHTRLKEKKLSEFCALLNFADGEGDYIAQRYKLHAEIAQLLAGTVDNPQIDTIAALVQEKALPNSDGRIVREDILQRFGATSERDLYPAPPFFEKLENSIPRKQHQELLSLILSASTPLIIHAAGGVGKTIFARQIAQSLPEGSLGIVYDSFGGGRYRNRSEPRHRHRDLLVQIANELASRGLCAPLVVQHTALEDEITRKFITRLSQAIASLKKTNDSAILAILIDAADNAEMAAIEFAEPCVVHELWRELLPEGCRLIALSRTERVHLLRPPSTVTQVELEPFSEEETLRHLRASFAEATDADGLEFHRLTSGNPRVQANALSVRLGTIAETLTSLGPSGTSIEKQLKAQLDSAINTIKDTLPAEFQRHIDSICTGLATLPPLIPIAVIAMAADVDEATVKSFVADLGRPLWLSDSSVQFRDEPTETWFRQNFSATRDQLASYAERLRPLAYRFTYVAETLPSLLLQAGQHRELIDLALSDDFLPQSSPIDERNVRVYRLQFAFKAALKLQGYAEAAKLALRAGEEVAGDKRQLELLTENVDLIAPLQNVQRVQELAYRRMLRGAWDGSENVYSAALLSSAEDFKGEARGYLRTATNWLRMYFEQRKQREERHSQDRLDDDDIAELTFAHFNLFGVPGAVDHILHWRPPEVILRIASKFIRRLVDAGRFDAIDQIERIASRSQYLMIALAHELMAVGRFGSVNALDQSLNLLATRRTRIPKPGYAYPDTIHPALLSFLEACSARKLSKRHILRVLRHYFPIRASASVSSNFQTAERDTFLRTVALRSVLEDNLEPNLDELVPKQVQEDKTYRREDEIREFKEVVGGLLPWYIVRARALVNDLDDVEEALKDADQRSKEARTRRWRDSDTIPFEISSAFIDVLLLAHTADAGRVERLIARYISNNTQIWIGDRLKAVRGAFRLNHLSKARSGLEQAARDFIISTSGEDPTTKAGWYIDLARSVLSVSRDDAAAYFDNAIEAVSKFGDEIVQRWEALEALARRSAEGGHVSPEMAYRFIRCAELVGENVAREKHWDRNEAIRICAQLSPASALAALSRWHDRDVGWFERQFPDLAIELVSSKYLPRSVGWCLSAFFEGARLAEFASLCIESEASTARRQYMLESAVRDLRLLEATEQSWKKLKQVAQQHSLESPELDHLLAYSPESERNKSLETDTFPSHVDDPVPIDWTELLTGLDLTTPSGISQAIERFDSLPNRFGKFDALWEEVFNRIDENQATNFLDALVVAEHADKYDIEKALSSLPATWRGKASVKRKRAEILVSVARRFAPAFTNRYILESYWKTIGIEGDLAQAFRKGILEGLSSSSEFSDASTYFGFAEIVSSFITPQEAVDLLHYGLTRFELHIETEFADGPWAAWLKPPEDASTAITGFIWAALGSPHAEMRWRAAHCVRRMGEIGCGHEIAALIGWMAKDSVGCFGSHRFPFYNLHARQYLLIALARIAADNPQILQPHHEAFSRHALVEKQHVIIQSFSANIALNIETAFPGTYTRDVADSLARVGVSQLPVREINKFTDRFDSYWHARGEIDGSLDFHHGWDFDRYWFEPLGEVFGIPGKQVVEIATQVVLKEWRVATDGSFASDPRASIWRSGRNEREVWHDHGGYPRIDNYGFYLSYHAMHVVAARLLQVMPVVHSRDWREDEWAYWLNRHLLTRRDGRWLADRRDPAPLLMPNWIGAKKTDNWRSDVVDGDFLDGILVERHRETWLNVRGSWEESDGERTESYYVTTALVSPAASQSLLNALTNCPDPHDFKLPDYEEERVEFASPPFELKGWVWRGDTDNKLDEYDPHAGQIAYPPYQVGKSIADQLQLSADSEQREWFIPGTDKACGVPPPKLGPGRM